MRYAGWLILLVCTQANAQIPRNNSGIFEYSRQVTLQSPSGPSLQEKAKNFFNQPFLVHWDSTYTEKAGDRTFIMGTGYINVRAKHRSFSVPRMVPVSLQLLLEVKGNSYRYTFNHFEVVATDSAMQFELEEKPFSVNHILYDQVLLRTHKRISFIIGWMKQYMADELEYMRDQ